MSEAENRVPAILAAGAAPSVQAWDKDGKLGKILAAQAALAASEGRAAESIELIRQGLLLGDATASTHFLIGVLVGQSVAHSSLQAARYALRRVPQAAAAKAWLPLLDDEAALARLRGSYALEFFAMHSWIGELPMGQTIEGVNDLGALLIWPFMKFDLASSYRGSLISARALGKPWAEAQKSFDEADRWVQENGWLFAQMSRPALARGYARGLSNAADIRLARAALSAQGYRARFGRWPGATDRLGVSLEDPFTGSSFAFEPGAKGLLIYSPGPDLKDEKGAPFDRQAMTGDISWLVGAR